MNLSARTLYVEMNYNPLNRLTVYQSQMIKWTLIDLISILKMFSIVYNTLEHMNCSILTVYYTSCPFPI